MASQKTPFIMLVAVICLIGMGGAVLYFGVGRYMDHFDFNFQAEPAPVFEVPLPVPPMDQTKYKVEIAIVEAKFAAKKAAKGSAADGATDIEYLDDPSRWDLKRQNRKSKTLKLD